MAKKKNQENKENKVKVGLEDGEVEMSVKGNLSDEEIENACKYGRQMYKRANKIKKK